MSNRIPTNPAPQQYVNGKLGGASDGATYEIVNPATGAVIGHAPDSTADDVNEAIAAARRAFAQAESLEKASGGLQAAFGRAIVKLLVQRLIYSNDRYVAAIRPKAAAAPKA